MYVDNHGRDNLSEFDQINESKALITNIPTKIITKEKTKIVKEWSKKCLFKTNLLY